MNEHATPTFFVLHLEEGSDRPEKQLAFEVQLLDSQGRAKSCGYLGTTETELVLDGLFVPQAVLDAARRQRPGKGDYVDFQGRPIQPF